MNRRDKRTPSAEAKRAVGELGERSSQRYTHPGHESKVRTFYHWAEGTSRMVLTLLGGEQRIALTRCRSGTIGMHLIDHREGTLCPVRFIGRFPSIDVAQEVAEAYADARFGLNHLARLNQSWRSQPPSSPQLHAMHRERIDPWRGMTNGDASDVLALHYVNRLMSVYHEQRRS